MLTSVINVERFGLLEKIMLMMNQLFVLNARVHTGTKISYG